MGMGLVIDTNENRSRKGMSFLQFLQITLLIAAHSSPIIALCSSLIAKG